MRRISFVIPALNEQKGISRVLRDIPVHKLDQMGYELEILVIDNGSHDHTVKIARLNGAHVIIQPIRGYGNAYKAGFANATGEIIVTGDADCTYPFSIIPNAINKMKKEHLDFINTDRLSNLNKEVMSYSHQVGNKILTSLCKLLYGWPFKDSQSGMWIFKRKIWKSLTVTASGMPFSQELKIEAYMKGFRCAEIPIDYRMRAGKEKNNTIRDGIGNILQLLKKRLTIIFDIYSFRIYKMPEVTVQAPPRSAFYWITHLF